MEWVETTARTVAEAQEAALDRLGVAADDAEFEVLEEPRSGLFGRVRGEARVRARIKPTPVRPKQERRRRGKTERTEGDKPREARSAKPRAAKSSAVDGDQVDGNEVDGNEVDGDQVDGNEAAPASAPRERSASSSRSRRGGRGGGGRSAASDDAGSSDDSDRDDSDRDDSDRDDSDRDDSSNEASSTSKGKDRAARRPREERPMNDQYDNDGDRDERPPVPPEEVGQAAVVFMDGLVEAFGAEGTSSLTIDGIELEVNVAGSDLGRLVGPGGRTLNAVQDLARVAAQRRLGDHETRLRIDVGGYRQRRQEALSKFAHSVAATVLETGEPRSMEPMTSADRKIVHDVLAEVDGVTSRSEGDDPNRRVVVVPA